MSGSSPIDRSHPGEAAIDEAELMDEKENGLARTGCGYSPGGQLPGKSTRSRSFHPAMVRNFLPLRFLHMSRHIMRPIGMKAAARDAILMVSDGNPAGSARDNTQQDIRARAVGLRAPLVEGAPTTPRAPKQETTGSTQLSLSWLLPRRSSSPATRPEERRNQGD